jgi:hypothetical protein
MTAGTAKNKSDNRHVDHRHSILLENRDEKDKFLQTAASSFQSVAFHSAAISN